MDRRSLIRIAVAGGAAGIVAPRIVLAGAMGDAMQSKLAGSVFYTRDAPGRWSKKVGGHLPNLEKQGGGGSTQVRVVTSHEMKGFEHYIVKHMLLDGKLGLLGEKMFDPMKDGAPISTFDLGGYSGPVYALSVCNIHDTWMNVIEV